MQNDLLEKIGLLDETTRKRFLKEWQKLVSREVKAYAKESIHESIFSTVKPSGSLFRVRSSRFNRVSLFGVKPNAGLLAGFSAPINERKTVKPYPVQTEHGWRMIRKLQIFSNYLGGNLKPANVDYFGTTERPNGAYFGLKKGRHIEARALIRGGVSLPVYSECSIPDWLMNDRRQEVENIIFSCGELALERTFGLKL